MSALGQKQTLRSSHVPKADFDYREILLRLDLPPSAAAESDAQC
jgi:hypothetical protein